VPTVARAKRHDFILQNFAVFRKVDIWHHISWNKLCAYNFYPPSILYVLKTLFPFPRFVCLLFTNVYTLTHIFLFLKTATLKLYTQHFWYSSIIHAFISVMYILMIKWRKRLRRRWWWCQREWKKKYWKVNFFFLSHSLHDISTVHHMSHSNCKRIFRMTFKLILDFHIDESLFSSAHDRHMTMIKQKMKERIKFENSKNKKMSILCFVSQSFSHKKKSFSGKNIVWSLSEWWNFSFSSKKKKSFECFVTLEIVWKNIF
jgi:AraC-like DNA-binding protein